MQRLLCDGADVRQPWQQPDARACEAADDQKEVLITSRPQPTQPLTPQQPQTLAASATGPRESQPAAVASAVKEELGLGLGLGLQREGWVAALEPASVTTGCGLLTGPCKATGNQCTRVSLGHTGMLLE
jgi:hypothetical protein